MKYSIADHVCEYKENAAASTFGMSFDNGKLFIAGEKCCYSNCTLRVFIDGMQVDFRDVVYNTMDVITAIVVCYYAGIYENTKPETSNVFPAAYTLMKCCNDIAAANKDYHIKADYPAAIEHTKAIYNK